ncbi:CPBP family intramembrane glutamic endopeptidase [Fulvivirga ligni]|uniref:CPBP family intramembrane glutamic endopeptidase n=1 Tax=Fulvivirga ligni TaxID=2904246 RepID=UPI001F46969C|nr:CPBP family intramembrane glutamic endopeptidase [Fulvivirga ligni]UII20095.1 CPBP family glutamic-type intramembrane protease [Fulvivirga ligni]
MSTKILNQDFSLQNRISAFIQLLLAYAFLYNPWTSFPYTFIIIIAAVITLVYLQDRNLQGIGLSASSNFLDTLKTVLIAFIIIEPIVDFIIQPLVNKLTGEVVDYSVFDFIAHDLSQYFKYLFFIIISAGFGEEILFRGFVYRQINIVLPNFKGKILLIIVLSAILFSIPHWYQGPGGVMITFIFGLAFATLYVKTNFNLLATILLHSLVDGLFITLAYFDKLDYYQLGNDLFFGF